MLNARHSITSFPSELFLSSLFRGREQLADSRGASVKVETAKVGTLGNSRLLRNDLGPAKLLSYGYFEMQFRTDFMRFQSTVAIEILSRLFPFISHFSPRAALSFRREISNYGI